MKKILLLLFLFALAFPGFPQQYNQYCNSVFNFCVDIPANFNRVSASKTGDGQDFSAKDGSTLSVFAIDNFRNETLKQHFDRTVASLTNDSSVANTTQLPVIEKAEIKDNSYTIIFLNKGLTNLIYRRLDNNGWKNIELQFATAKSENYLARANRMISSLR